MLIKFRASSIHDRDSIYGADFRRRVRGLGTRLLATPPRAPKANAFGERVIGTLRRDCFDHIIVRDEHHAQRVLHDYVAHYNGRPHRGLRMQPPDGSRHLPPRRPPNGTRIVGIPILGGLHHRYGFAVPARAPPSVEMRAA
jgi:transposase InsO family protein